MTRLTLTLFFAVSALVSVSCGATEEGADAGSGSDSGAGTDAGGGQADSGSNQTDGGGGQTDAGGGGLRSPGVGDLVINEVLADPAGGNPTDTEGNARGDANGDGTRSSRDDEFVELVNASGATLDLDGVEIHTRGSRTTTVPVEHRYTIPAGTSLEAGKAIVIFGGGSPTGTFGGSTVLVTSSQTCSSGQCLSLANGGDLVRLILGSTTVDEHSYDESLGEQDQSMVRSPEVTGAFALHTSVATGVSQSPGTKADGTSF